MSYGNKTCLPSCGEQWGATGVTNLFYPTKKSYLQPENIVSEDWSHWQGLKMAMSFNALAQRADF